MAYAHTDRAAVKSRLAEKLSDSSKVFFTDTELNSAVDESIRFINLVAGIQRARKPFNTTAGQPFYALQSAAPTELGMTITDQTLITEIQRHLLQTASATSWTWMDANAYEELVSAIRRRRTRFLIETGCVVTRDDSIALPSPPTPRLTLSSSILDIRRLAYRNPSGRYHILSKTNEHDALMRPSWNVSAGTPYGYSPLASAPHEIQFIPPPLDTGTLDAITVNEAATLNPAAGATALGIPNDLCWAIKYGVMADLLSKDGPGRDLLRAVLCEKKYRLGVILARTMPTVLTVEINGRAVRPYPIRALDLSQPGWQGRKRGVPTDALIAGPNMIAVSPVPNSQPASITLDFIRSAEVPTADGHQIQLGIEHIPTLLDLCEAYLTFKCGAMEAKLGEILTQRALAHAIHHNARLSKHGSATLMRDISKLEDEMNPKTGRADGGLGALSEEAVMASQQAEE